MIPNNQFFYGTGSYILSTPTLIGSLVDPTYISSDYDETGGINVDYNGTNLHLYGASIGTPDKTVHYNKWYGCSDNFTVETFITVNDVSASAYGIGFYLESPGQAFRMTIGTATGLNNGNISLNPAGSSSALSGSIDAGDVLRIRYVVFQNNVTLIVDNVNKALQATIPFQFNFNEPLNSGTLRTYFSLGFTFFGGDFSNITWSVISSDYTYGDLLLVGDSKTWGLYSGGTTVANRIGGLWQAANPTKKIYVNAGVNETTNDWLLLIPEFLKFKPKIVIISAPSNDVRFGISSGTTQTNLTTIRDAFLSVGIRVIYQNPYVEDSLDQSSLVTIGAAVFSEIISSPWTFAGRSVNLSSDGVHLSPTGNTNAYNNQAAYLTLP